MTFQNIRIGRRLGLAFGIVLVLMLIVVVVGANRFAHVQATTKQMVEKEWVKAEAANAINATTRAQARRTMELFLASDSAQRDKIYAHIEANKKIIVAALETLDKLIYLPKGKALLATIRTEREAYVASFTKVGELIDAGDLDEAKRVMMGETLPNLDRLQTSVAELAELQKQIANAAAENVSKATTQGTNLLIGLGLGALVIAAVLALLITRSIVRPINNAVNIAKTIAGGDLTSTINVRYSDETGQLLGALKEMNDSLLRVVSEVRAGTDTVSTASSQIAAGNLDLSSRTEEQASALEETAATMEEITSTVKQNAEHARVANQLASSASSVASRGGEIVAEVVRTMDTIHQSSRKITDITGVIDGIAFQTNILALNAAVEAARAGEQGRGFAVVATEVRTLAQRASAAAREIKALIENSVEAVDTGCRLVEQAGSTMDEIVVSVRRVTDIMGEISGASDEQTTGISQVNEAVNQMDQVTQQNAALVEESAAAAASLEDKAAELARVVATFKLATDERLSDTQGNGPSGRIAQQVRRPSPLAGRRVPRLANAS